MTNRYRNVAFLAELLVNILVFSISCAIMVGLFGQASKMARETREESFATQEIYALFETIRLRGPGAVEGAAPTAAGGLQCYYNEDWTRTDKENAAYTIELSLDEETAAAGLLLGVEARASDRNGQEICTLSTKTYHPDEGGVPA